MRISLVYSAIFIAVLTRVIGNDKALVSCAIFSQCADSSAVMDKIAEIAEEIAVDRIVDEDILTSKFMGPGRKAQIRKETWLETAQCMSAVIMINNAFHAMCAAFIITAVTKLTWKLAIRFMLMPVLKLTAWVFLE